MLFLTGLLWYLFLFLCLAGVAVGGIFMGKHLRMRKNMKGAESK